MLAQGELLEQEPLVFFPEQGVVLASTPPPGPVVCAPSTYQKH